MLLAAEPGDDLNLDGNASRQLGHTDRCTGMAPGITEHLDQQIRAPIQDRRGLVKTRGHVHHAKDLDNPLDPVQIAQFGLKGGENRQGRRRVSADRDGARGSPLVRARGFCPGSAQPITQQSREVKRPVVMSREIA